MCGINYIIEELTQLHLLFSRSLFHCYTLALFPYQVLHGLSAYRATHAVGLFFNGLNNSGDCDFLNFLVLLLFDVAPS